MKKLFSLIILIGLFFMAGEKLNAQALGTLELTRGTPSPTNSGFGTGILPMEATFKSDLLNNNAFSTNSPVTTVSVSFKAQQFTGYNYGTAVDQNQLTTGLSFGAGPSLAGDNFSFGPTPYNRYNIIGEYGGTGGPTDNLFTSSPTGTPGTGIRVQAGNPALANGAFEIFTAAQVLFGSANGVGSRVYFGDIVMHFSAPVKNPVIHVAGLGGSYSYLKPGFNNVPANYVSAFFATELELQNTGVTSTILSGNQFLSLAGNNVLNNNNANPNGGSVFSADEAPFNNLGAATGSIRINGTIQDVVYRVYLQSGTASNFPWSATAEQVQPGSTRPPFTGDIWYIAASLDKPVQQISGNVFNDRDGLTDGNINTSVGVANLKTNAGGLNANLILGGTVLATTPVTPEGVFLFDNVTAGTYTVQLSTTTNTSTSLPANWFNTGDFIGAGAGSDGLANGVSAPVVVGASDIKTEVNFGIERAPDSRSFSYTVPRPVPNSSITLTGTYAPLTGTDPEDKTVEGSLSGLTVKITALPTYSTLRYAGSNVTLNQIITNYTPASLSFLFNVPVPPTEGYFTQFSYAYVDLAGIADPSPATYRLSFPAPSVVPVNLEDFSATNSSCNASASWTTSNEVNLSKYQVEYSTNGTSFDVFATVTPRGTGSSRQSYSASTDMKANLTYYFRLKMINIDGSASYSDVVKLNCNSKSMIAINPNPVIDIFTVKGMAAGNNTVLVYANDGRLVAKKTINGTTGPVNISNFTAGTYAVKIISENGSVYTDQIIKR